jgi:lipopolysaccharide export system ATP-binding protein
MAKIFFDTTERRFSIQGETGFQLRRLKAWLETIDDPDSFKGYPNLPTFYKNIEDPMVRMRVRYQLNQQLSLGDKDITGYPMYRRAQMGIGYLPQEASVFRKMTVEDNLRAVLEMTDFSKEYQEEKVEQLIKEFNLAHVRHNLGDRLSGGERRRTEIARCLAIEPKFVMLDEPFAGVDPIAVQEIQDVVWRLKDKNIGILITDHNVDETLMITDRAYLLFEGRILFHGTPEELAANPTVRKNYLGRDFELKRKTREEN